jgi:hypothetical protein
MPYGRPPLGLPGFPYSCKKEPSVPLFSPETIVPNEEIREFLNTFTD